MKRKVTITDYFDRMNEVNKKVSVKSLTEFDHQNSNSIKAVIVKQNQNIKPKTRFDFVYDIIDVFMFPDEETKNIYEKYNIEKCYVYQCLTDTDSTSINFIFICNLNCDVTEENARKIIFEVMISSKILERLDLSDDFWNQFNVQNKKLKSKLVYLKLKV